MLGWVAAVKATESPSQERPALIQRMCTTGSAGWVDWEGFAAVATSYPLSGRYVPHASRPSCKNRAFEGAILANVHELSIAMSLIEAACEEVERLGDVRVEALHLRLGALSGVVREALEFSFDLAAEGTAIAGARLQIEEVPVAVLCPRCNAERQLPSLQCFRCPVCDTPTPDVVRGRELELKALEIAEIPENAVQDR